MKSISLFIDKNSFLNKMHPYTKLLYVIVAIAVPFVGGRLWLFPFMIACSIALLAAGKVLGKALPLISFAVTIVLVIFIVQGLYNHNNREEIFAILRLRFYKEGLLYAAKISLNILNMLLAFAVFVLTTSVYELVDEMEKSGFSPKFGYIITSVFQILPQMMATKDTIVDAQRSRGMETEGKMSVRIKAFFPLISPVVSSSLINTKERAVALEVRGFGRDNKKTFMYDHPKSKADIAAYVIFGVALVLAVAIRVIL